MPRSRPIGTMITHGFPGIRLQDELNLAVRIGASVVEILPHWSARPSAEEARRTAADLGIEIQSAHGGWGRQTVAAPRIDLGSTEPTVRRESVDDLRWCVDWLEEAGGRLLIVHPGGLSDPDEADARRESLAQSLIELADHAAERTTVCVENMPPGVHPGSRMTDLAAVLAKFDHPRLALALDTGHAELTGGPAAETHAAGGRLATTHVHDNDGRRDLHLIPGDGVIDWTAWKKALDQIDYQGSIMLECIRMIRDAPDDLNPRLFEILKLLADSERSDST